MKVLVLTLSDRASRGEYSDKSGPAVEAVLKGGLEGVEISRKVISDEYSEIEKVFHSSTGLDFILTTGGTGIGPRDNTPDVTEKVCERLIPGLGEYLRAESVKQTVNAVLSRGTAGVFGRTIIINLPGSERGARFCAELLLPILPHAARMLKGESH